jgi:hypothetical protein
MENICTLHSSLISDDFQEGLNFPQNMISCFCTKLCVFTWAQEHEITNEKNSLELVRKGVTPDNVRLQDQF